MAVVSMKQLLEAGVHFGHQTRRWNPKMAKYIFTERNGIYIIDLQKTVKKLDEAYNFVRDTAAQGGEILFVGTKKQAQDSIRDEATRCGMHYVNARWLGGMMTNFRTIRKRIDRMEQLKTMQADGTFDLLPKKEVVKLELEMEKLDKYLGGKTDDEWIKVGFETSGVPEDLTFEEFKERQYYAFPTREDWKDIPAGIRQFHDDPEGHPLRTPSGKLEYYSTTLSHYFPDDRERGPIPHWIDEGAGHQERQYLERGRKYPFLLVSNHPHFRVHAQHDDVTWFREIETCKVTGPDGYKYEPVWVNPVDAGKLGLSTGDVVKVYNERGAVLGGVIVTERIMPGAVYQDHGARCDTIVLGEGGLDRGGANNLIAPTATTSKNAHGEVTSGFLVNIEKVDVFALAEQYPEAFGRDYEPDCGLVATARVVDGKEGE